jgi:hypothetical protein
MLHLTTLPLFVIAFRGLLTFSLTILSPLDLSSDGFNYYLPFLIIDHALYRLRVSSDLFLLVYFLISLFLKHIVLEECP